MTQVTYSNVQVTSVLLKRGNTIQNNRYVGLAGEATVDTQAYTLRVHDGSTPGGHIVTGGYVNALANGAATAALTTSGNLVFTDGTVLTIANGTALVNGTIIAGSNNFSNINVTAYLGGSVTIGNLTVLGNITTVNTEIINHNEIVSGNITSNNTVTALRFVGNGSQLTGLPAGFSNVNLLSYLTVNVPQGTYSNANLQSYLTLNPPIGTYTNANVASYLPTYNGNIGANISKGGHTWTFDSTGLLTVPGDIYFNNNSGVIEQGANRLTITGNAIQVNTGAYFNDDGEAAIFANTSVQIATDSNSVNPPLWDFSSTGNLTFPTGASIVNGYPGPAGSAGDGQSWFVTSNIAGGVASSDGKQYVQVDNGGTIYIGTNYTATTGNTWTFGQTGIMSLPYSNYIQTINTNMTVGTQGGLTIISNAAGGATNYNWTFGQNGRLTFPDTTVQQTAWLGTVTWANVTGIPALYSNVNAQSLITSLGLSNYSNVNTAAYTQTMGYTNFSNVNVAAYVSTYVNSGSSSYSNVNVAAYLSTNSYLTATSANLNNYAWTSNVITANTGIKGYVDNSTSTANIGIKGYVDSQSFYSNAKVATYLQYGSIGNISVAGNVTAGYFIGNGALLTGIAASSNYSNVQVATYLPTYAGNIANVRLGVAGVLTFADGTTQTTASTGGGTSYSNVNVAAYLNTQGYNLYSNVNVAAYLAGTSYTGYSNVNVNAWFSANIAASLYSNVNVASYLAGNITVGTISLTGNVNANNLVGSAANTTITAGAFVSTFNNAGNVLMPNVVVTGNVTAAYFLGNGALLTGIAASSSYSNVQVATYLPTYSGVVTASNVAVAGNITAQYLFGNGALLTGIVTSGGSNYSNTNVIAYLNATGYNLYSNVNVAAYLSTATINTTGNITAGNLTSTNGLYVANITTTGSSGNISGANYITANVILTNGGWGNISQVANIQANAVLVSGNVTATYFLGNGALLTGIAASSNYSNVQVATYLPTYSGNIANITLSTSGVLTFADGTTQTTASGSSYSNVNVTTFLSNSSAIFVGNTGSVSLANVYPLQSNITQFFVGNQTTLTSGAGLSTTTTYLMNNLYFLANGVAYYRNTQSGAAWMTIAGSGINFAGTSGAVTANTAQSMGSWAQLNASGFVTYNSVGITSAGTLAVNGAGGMTTTQTTFPLINTTATTINFGGAATAINMGAAAVAISVGSGAGNITAGNFIGSGQFLTSLPGYAYSNVNVAAYSQTQGYTNYSNVNVAAYTAGLTNYSNVNTAAYLSTATINTTGNITAAYVTGNISITGNVIGTTANYTGNVTVGNLSVTGNLSANLLSITANSITGTGANTTIIAGAYTSVFDNQGNVTVPKLFANGNIQSTGYIFGNAAFLTGLASSYSNVQVATYLANVLSSTGNIYAGNIVASGYGYFPGAYNESATAAGVFIGNTGSGTPSPRIGFYNGNVTQNWQIDNYFGTFRWFTPGVSQMTLDPSGNVSILGTTANALVVSGGTILQGNLTVNGITAITMPNCPAFRVTGQGSAQNTGANLTSSNWTVDYTQGNSAAYLNGTNGNFTAPVAGLYQTSLTARTSTNTNATLIQAVIYQIKGGTQSVALMIEWGPNTTFNHASGSTTVKLAVGDKLYVACTANGGGSGFNFDGNDHWDVVYLG